MIVLGLAGSAVRAQEVPQYPGDSCVPASGVPGSEWIDPVTGARCAPPRTAEDPPIGRAPVDAASARSDDPPGDPAQHHEYPRAQPLADPLAPGAFTPYP
jgi:hypothetical protein